jgi:hypothetical protein
MPGPHAFWVIVDGTTPTSFRAKHRDDLVPTLTQLLRTQPAVVLRWFDRGQLWESPIAAREALEAKRRMRSDRPPTWRPGGSHVDPRERYKLTRDQKRARFKKRSWGKPAGTDEKPGWQTAKPGSPDARKPGSWGERRAEGQPARKPWGSGRRKPGGYGGSKPQSWGSGKPGGGRPRKPGSWKAAKPGAGRPFTGGQGGSGGRRGFGNRPAGPRGPRKPRGPGGPKRDR